VSEAAVKVQGARELRTALRKLGDDLGDFADIHARVAGLVAADARPRIRSRTGRLAGSGRTGAAKTSATVRYGGARVPYANAVHWGYRGNTGQRGPHNIRPNRFAVDAAHETEPQWTDVYYAGLEAYVAAAIARSRNHV
jgi:hypothetical protein